MSQYLKYPRTICNIGNKMQWLFAHVAVSGGGWWMGVWCIWYLQCWYEMVKSISTVHYRRDVLKYSILRTIAVLIIILPSQNKCIIFKYGCCDQYAQVFMAHQLQCVGVPIITSCPLQSIVVVAPHIFLSFSPQPSACTSICHSFISWQLPFHSRPPIHQASLLPLLLKLDRASLIRPLFVSTCSDALSHSPWLLCHPKSGGTEKAS